MSRGKSVLVTGASGFLGRYVAECFAADGWEVIGLGRRTLGTDRERCFDAYHQMALSDPALHEIVRANAPALCIHCAGGASVGASVDDPASDFYSGPVVTFDLLEVLRRHAPDCAFLFLSSAAVYGNPLSLPVKESQPPQPISPYGFHKLQCELLCKEFADIFGMRTASARIFSAYGVGLHKQVLWDISQKALGNGVVHLQGTGRESRDFIHAQDVAVALRLIAAGGAMRGECYNVASGREIKIAEISQALLDALHVEREIRFDGKAPAGVPLNWRADVSGIEALGFQVAVSLEQGLAEFAEWARRQYR